MMFEKHEQFNRSLQEKGEQSKKELSRLAIAICESLKESFSNPCLTFDYEVAFFLGKERVDLSELSADNRYKVRPFLLLHAHLNDRYLLVIEYRATFDYQYQRKHLTKIPCKFSSVKKERCWGYFEADFLDPTRDIEAIVRAKIKQREATSLYKDLVDISYVDEVESLPTTVYRIKWQQGFAYVDEENFFFDYAEDYFLSDSTDSDGYLTTWQGRVLKIDIDKICFIEKITSCDN